MLFIARIEQCNPPVQFSIGNYTRDCIVLQGAFQENIPRDEKENVLALSASDLRFRNCAPSMRRILGDFLRRKIGFDRGRQRVGPPGALRAIRAP
jgi:hypothetical protein